MSPHDLAAMSVECEIAWEAYTVASRAVDVALTRRQGPTEREWLAEADALVRLRAARAAYVAAMTAYVGGLAIDAHEAAILALQSAAAHRARYSTR